MRTASDMMLKEVQKCGMENRKEWTKKGVLQFMDVSLSVIDEAD